MSTIYTDHTYLKNNPTWHEEDAPFKANKIISLLDRNSIGFETVCEIGCGSGEILVQLADKFKENVKLVGFDISEDAIRIAKGKENGRIKFEQADIAQATKNQFFDLLLVIDVIEHIDNYFDFLKNINPKGKYTVFHIPLDMCVWSLFREKILIESKDRVGHIHNFTEEFIENILMDKGFKVIDKIYTEPLFSTMTIKQKIVNGIRKVLFFVNQKFTTKTLGGYSILLLTENNKQKQS